MPLTAAKSELSVGPAKTGVGDVKLWGGALIEIEVVASR